MSSANTEPGTTSIGWGEQLLGQIFPSIELGRSGERDWQADGPTEYCGRCGASAGPGSVTGSGCAVCVGEYLPWERVVRLGAYQRPMDQWITAMKFGGDWSRAVWLGCQIAREIRSMTPADRTVVCPVPMHWLRRCHRGYNQAELIGRAVAQTNGFRVADVLRRVRYTRPQTTVAVSRRDSNLSGSLAIGRVDLTGWHVWLVDDVKTTGATLFACARVLRQVGARQLSVAVAAVAGSPNHV